MIKILPCPNLKAFADDRLKVAHIEAFVSDRVKTMWQKEEIQFTRISPFSTLFSQSFLSRVVETWDCSVNCLTHDHTMTTFDALEGKAF